MKLYHVVAMADGRVIGKDNKLPWHFSSDLKHFKQLTTGSTVLMGRKTFESIGKPLPGRENFVLTRHPERSEGSEILRPSGLRKTENVRFFDSFDKALTAVRTPDCYIIGGSQIFKQTLPKVDGIYLTQIEGRYEGDTFYPELPPQFKEKSRTKLQDNPLIEVIYYENQKAKP